MSKGSGGVRPLATKQIPAREKEYRNLMATGEYGDSYFSPSGGFVVSENTKVSHSEEEWEAAIALADNGYRVILKNEAGMGKTRDGDLILFGEYEQRTPKGSGAINFKGVLRHARDKNADIALAYQKEGTHSRDDIEKAISEFESESKYRFKRIIVVTKDGRIHTHFHKKEEA